MAGAGAPPGDPDPSTLAVVTPGRGWLALLGLAPAGLVAATGPALGLADGVVIALTLVAAGAGLALGWRIVGQRWDRIWRDVTGSDLPPTLMVGLTPDHLVVWAMPTVDDPAWRPHLVLDRATTRLRPTVGGLGPFVVSTPDGDLVPLDGDGPSHGALRRMAADLGPGGAPD